MHIYNSIDNDNLFPRIKFAVIKYTAMFLEKDKSAITYSDVEKFRNWLIDRLHLDNLSPFEITKLLGISHSDFGMFIKKCMKIDLKNHSEALLAYKQRIGKSITDEKEKYWAECKFKFDPFNYTQLEGYELLFQFKFCNPITNKEGICRDHMYSISDGWLNEINPTFISHPANCQIMLAIENCIKNSSSSITLDHLLERIKYWDSNILSLTKIIPKKVLTKDHKDNLAKSISKQQIYTDGIINIKQDKELPSPIGYRKGMIRKK